MTTDQSVGVWVKFALRNVFCARSKMPPPQKKKKKNKQKKTNTHTPFTRLNKSDS